jgi:hypothetical protein
MVNVRESSGVASSVDKRKGLRPESGISEEFFDGIRQQPGLGRGDEGSR